MTTKLNSFLVKVGLVSLSFFSIALSSPLQVDAQTPLSLRPGQTGRFSVAYDNAGEGGENMQNVLLSVFVGSELIVDPNSITDEFNGSQEFRVVPSTLKDHNVWGSVIEYQPRSANNPSSPSGTDQPGNVTMPNGQQGILRFNATLKQDVLQRYQVGDVLQFDAGEGVYEGVLSRLSYNGQNATDSTSVTIVAPLEQPASSSSVAQSSVVPPASQPTSTPTSTATVRSTNNTQTVTPSPVLPRTGGPLIALVVAGVAALGGGLTYRFSRRRKMKINK